MATKTRVSKNTKKQAQAQRKAQYTAETTGADLHGYVITWSAGEGKTHAHKDVVQALADTGLDVKVARELLPRYAFARAAKKMSEDRLIDLFKEDGDIITFQFTKRTLANESFEFHKETMLELNKTTGAVHCSIPELETLAQNELVKAIDGRTSADITRIVQRLCEGKAGASNADLMSLRDAGGVYFVPVEQAQFLFQIKTFLAKLGGSLNPFPIRKGDPVGDSSIQETVKRYFDGLINRHLEAVKEFGIDTRADTLERAADNIKNTRAKLQAYAHYLGETASELSEAVDAANQELVQRVQVIAGQKAERDANAPPKPARASKTERDEFGNRTGTVASKINSLLNGQPQTLDALEAATGCPRNSIWGHIFRLVKKGLVKKQNGGYVLAQPLTETETAGAE